VSGCQTPEKIPHRSKYAALVARDELERTKGIDLALKPYPCCGHWHLGHSKKSTYARWTKTKRLSRNTPRRKR